MHKEFLMGNAAIALGAVAAGVNVVALFLLGQSPVCHCGVFR